MSIHDEELRRRLERGDDIEATAKWYIEVMAESPNIKWKDLTVFEVRFWKRIHRAFMRWRKLRMN